MPVIRFYANLRTLADQPSLEMDAASFPTLRAVLVELTRRFPEMESHLLDARGRLRQDVPVFVNGRNARLQSAGLDSILGNQDTISLFSPIASGRMNVEVLRDASEGGAG